MRPSRRARWRALSLTLVYVLFAAHVIHWKLAGRTLSPVEPSEAMQTLGQGLVNCGAVFFLAAILSTLFLGRFFCGWGCHIVALQDLCSWALKKLGLTPRPFASRLLVFVPLLAAIYMFAAPSVVRSWMGIQPPEFQAHFFTDDLWATFPGWVVAALTFLVCGFLIVYVLGNKGFCTYGCPYGGIFGAADQVAFGKIRVTDACEGCAHCTATCTSNVRVHEEVKLYGMVVNPGCMKCMDCISVCPKDALYFGFGAPSVAKGRPRAKRAPRKFDFTWREEIALVVFFLCSVVILRTLYDAVPFLLALGASAISAALLLTVARLFYVRDVRMARLQLRREGKVTAGGVLVGALAILWTAFLVHSGALQYELHVGYRSLRAADAAQAADGDRASPATLQIYADSLSWMQRAEKLALFSMPNLDAQIASACEHLGDAAAAEKHYRHAASVAPGFAWAHYELARFHQARGERDQVVSELKEVVRTRPDLKTAHADLAALLVQMGRSDEAVAMLADLLRRQPHNVDFRLTYGMLLARLGDTERGLQETRAALRDHPDHPRGLYNLGAILTAAREYELALPALQRAAELDPESADAHYLYGHVAGLLNRWGLALGQVNLARDLHPYDGPILRLWCKSLEKTGGLAEATAAAERAMNTDRAARYRLMFLYQAAGRADEANRILAEFGPPEPAAGAQGGP